MGYCFIPRISTVEYINSHLFKFRLIPACKKIDGNVGDGTSQGTCPVGKKCYEDRLCKGQHLYTYVLMYIYPRFIILKGTLFSIISLSC